MKGKPNILLITVDALRARNLSCYGYHKNTSPNIDELGREGIIFDKAFSCFNATDPSLSSIFTGKYPLSIGIVHHGDDNSEPSNNLAKILKANGYATLGLCWLDRWRDKGFDYYGYYGSAMVTSIRGFVKKAFNMLPLGFGHFVSVATMARLHRTKVLDAQTITNHAIKVLSHNLDEKKPFFLFIHYMDTHLPYHPPEDIEKIFFEESSSSERIEDILKKIKNPEWKSFLKRHLGDALTTDDVIAKCDGAIAHVDRNIRNLLGVLDLDNTIIIITSDHGESLTEHSIYFNQHGLYDESIHVPLIIYYPGCPKGKRVSSLVQHVDIVPTILDILNIRNENFCFDGETLIPLIKGERKWIRSAVFAEESSAQRKRALRTENFKYIYNVLGDRIACDFESSEVSKEEGVCQYCGFIHGGLEELYDLKKDPGEVQNIVNERGEIAKALKEDLLDLIKNLEYKKKRDKIG